MSWSFSESRTFLKCQRRWYFDWLLAYWTQKDRARWEAYLLSKMQSVSAWRGQIVDSAISTVVIPAIDRRQRPNLQACLSRAEYLFRTQREFALGHRIREEGLVPSKAGDAFAAFLCIEHGQQVSQDELDKAWSEIDQAIRNLFGMDDLFRALATASRCIAQRALTFDHLGISVKAVPDAIAFFDNQPPLIVDWKVHAFGTKDYWLQLVTYALALTRCKPHKDFPRTFKGCAPTAVRLFEVQLLTNRLREHSLEEDDVGEVEDMIAESASHMALALDGRKLAVLEPADFPVTSWPENCESCPFRRPCWESAP